MALTQPTAPSISSTTTTTTTTQPTLPSPQLFDILPALHEILSRIDHHNSDPNTAELTLDIAYTNSTTLEPKDLPTAMLPLKAQIRKGLKELEKLPDMERSVQEQREEIAELEERIRRQKGMLREMGAMGREMEYALRTLEILRESRVLPATPPSATLLPSTTAHTLSNMDDLIAAFGATPANHDFTLTRTLSPDAMRSESGATKQTIRVETMTQSVDTVRLPSPVHTPPTVEDAHMTLAEMHCAVTSDCRSKIIEDAIDEEEEDWSEWVNGSDSASSHLSQKAAAVDKAASSEKVQASLSPSAVCHDQRSTSSADKANLDDHGTDSSAELESPLTHGIPQDPNPWSEVPYVPAQPDFEAHPSANPWLDGGTLTSELDTASDDDYGGDLPAPASITPPRRADTTLSLLEQEDHISIHTDSLNSLLSAPQALRRNLAQLELNAQHRLASSSDGGAPKTSTRADGKARRWPFQRKRGAQ